MRLVRPLVFAGDREARYNLGILYDKGQGVPQDYAERIVLASGGFNA
jgi:TPR repeat protein